MAYNYPNYKADQYGVYGDEDRSHRYKPAPYHNPTARRSAVKTRWCLIPPQQFEVFRVADDDYDIYSDASGLFGFLDQMNEILGLDNEERLAFFPKSGDHETWHGYPIDSKGIDDDLIERWNDKGLLSIRNYRLLLKHWL